MASNPASRFWKHRRILITAIAVGVLAVVPVVTAGRGSSDTVTAGQARIREAHGLSASPAVRATLTVGSRDVEIAPFGMQPTQAELERAALQYLAAVAAAEAAAQEASAPRTRSLSAASAPAPQPVEVPADAVHQAIAAYFGDAYSEAVAIAECESGLNPNAVSSGGGNWGLFQINVTHRDMVEGMGYSWDQILDPWVNSDVAYTLYAGSGWQPWACRWVL